jgi:hypothetical protein
MLTSSRFSTIPTLRTRERLEKALGNRKPISRRERNKSAVMAIQGALADLNRDYLLPAEVDGYFGSRTYGAVEAFQRDYGLVADGQVGQQTLKQLDSLYSEGVIRQTQGMSIHIGVDRVDANHYGAEHPLNSCANDARKMEEFANAVGYDTLLLVNEEATVANFTTFMRSAIENLFDGDSLFITFSGHGAQVPNLSADAEDDGKDETLCFYDRMLIDDEIYNFLGRLSEGVRVHLVFDSCHSGSAAKVLVASQEDKVTYQTKTLSSLKSLTTDGGQGTNEMNGVLTEVRPISNKSLDKALRGGKPEYDDAPIIKKDNDKEISTLFADLFFEENNGPAKSIELFNGIYNRNKLLYDSVIGIIGFGAQDQLRCSVISISACQDTQTTPAGSYLSLFTYNIAQTWKSGGFEGSYTEFLKSIVRETGRTNVVPVINTYGPSRSRSMLYERPFFI